MLKGIDHVVIVVHDLDRASADFAAMGFTVVRGGEHTGGVTHNALVAFEDESYLELVAFMDAPPEEHPFYRKHGEEGLVTFALLPEDIVADVAAIERRGLDLEGPRRGGRTRPDGVNIEWETAWSGTRDLPFLCADVTARDLRVPHGPARLHANGVKGIAGVTIAVADLKASAPRYAALLGVTQERSGASASESIADFKVGEGDRAATITLVEPVGGPIEAYYETRGEGPFSLALRADALSAADSFDPERMHGVLMGVV
ncbi:MAG TPA: VOC family protein [Chloroflexia bacterium]|nr:VOC family protein [Chloroflexia bacterium]